MGVDLAAGLGGDGGGGFVEQGLAAAADMHHGTTRAEAGGDLTAKAAAPAGHENGLARKGVLFENVHVLLPWPGHIGLIRIAALPAIVNLFTK